MHALQRAARINCDGSHGIKPSLHTPAPGKSPVSAWVSSQSRGLLERKVIPLEDRAKIDTASAFARARIREHSHLRAVIDLAPGKERLATV